MKIILASHGTLAGGMKSSLEIILGNADNVRVIDAYLDCENLEDKLNEVFLSIPEEEQVIMLADLYGASVTQKMYLYLSRPNTFLVAGMNLALVIQLAMRTEPIDLEILQSIVEECQKSIQIVEYQTTNVAEEDFFEDR